MRSLEEIIELIDIKTKSKDLKKVLYDKYIKNRVNYNILDSYPELILLFKKSKKINLNKINWSSISINQNISEDFIREFQDKLDWHCISVHQKLSEDFIREFSNEIDWLSISCNQKLSESFIREFKDKVYWHCISNNQKLSESFIKEFYNKVNWFYISIYQELSESFIREFKDYVYWNFISKYQKLSKEFIKEFNLVISDDNWLYKSGDFKLDKIRKTRLYEIEGDYIIGYKGIKSNRHSKFNFQFQYLKDETYECHANHNIKEENSFGLSVWNYENAFNYCNELVVKVKIHKDNISALVHNGNKIRATKITILN